MTDPIDWHRWQGRRGHFTYWKGWMAWQAYRLLDYFGMPSWSYRWLLPSVGDWAYWEQSIQVMKREMDMSSARTNRSKAE